MTDDTPRRGRPRRQGADAEILAAARELLEDRGYRAFTVDAVAERTGIAKTTIYRRWPSKGGLVAALIGPPRETSEPAEVLRETVAALALLAEPDAEAIEVLHAVLEPRQRLLAAAFEPHANANVAAELIIGALLSRLLIARQTPTLAFAESLLRLVRPLFMGGPS